MYLKDLVNKAIRQRTCFLYIPPNFSLHITLVINFQMYTDIFSQKRNKYTEQDNLGIEI